jgi:hypothetical protein
MNLGKIIAMCSVMAITACATRQKKDMLDVGANDGKPDWVNSTKMTWTEGDQVLFRTQYTVRGDERVNGCYQLAKLETKEALLREIQEEIRGQIDSAQQSISESAEVILNQSRRSEFSGRVTGFRFLEQYHERYKIDGTERIDCFMMGAIKKSDYETIRRAVVYRLIEVDPGLRTAMSKRQIDFFSEAKTTEMAPVDSESLRAPAKPKTSVMDSALNTVVALPEKAQAPAKSTNSIEAKSGEGSEE